MSNIGNKDIMSKNLKYYIEKSGKDRRELSEIWGFPYSTVTEWINGRKYPRIDRIEVMADYFGILKSDLIEDKQKQSTDGELSIRKKAFMQKVESMSDDQIARLEQILALVENTEL
jgi:transcriptional regulator with XRE-family HTH domain